MRKGAQLLIGFALIGGCGWLIWRFALAAAGWYSNLGSDESVAITGVIGLSVVALLTFLSNRVLERRRSVETATRAKRVELYEDFVKFFLRIFSPEQLGQRPDGDEMLKFMAEVTPVLITYGSNEVVQRWGKLRVTTLQGSQQPHEMMVDMEAFFKAIRKDLGHGSFGMKDGDILRLWVNDIDEVLAKGKK